MRRRYPVSLNGVTLRGLIAVANQMHLASRPLRFEMHDLGSLNMPAIVHWDLNHFVVLRAVGKGWCHIHDPAVGIKTYPLTVAAKHLTGVALELSPAEGFVRKNERVRLPLRAFWGQMRGLMPPLVRVFQFQLVLEVFVIAAPLYNQLMVDEVIARGDTSLMQTLASGSAC